ncbi:MAG: hypothetical protein IT292_06320 [Deltaproteobacteria bacterium]|nr:hypothetical protein [Deltaproteobacteria bacterium]
MSTVDFHSRYQGLNSHQLEKLRPKEKELTAEEKHARDRAGKAIRFVGKLILTARKEIEIILSETEQELNQLNTDLKVYAAVDKLTDRLKILAKNPIDILMAVMTNCRKPLRERKAVVEGKKALYEKHLDKINAFIHSDEPSKNLSLLLIHELYQSGAWEDARLLAEQTIKNFNKYLLIINRKL